MTPTPTLRPETLLVDCETCKAAYPAGEFTVGVVLDGIAGHKPVMECPSSHRTPISPGVVQVPGVREAVEAALYRALANS